MQQCEWASVQTWRSPHSHHSPPEPNASHTPTAMRQRQCIDSQTDNEVNICCDSFIASIDKWSVGAAKMQHYCVAWLILIKTPSIALAAGMDPVSVQTKGLPFLKCSYCTTNLRTSVYVVRKGHYTARYKRLINVYCWLIRSFETAALNKKLCKRSYANVFKLNLKWITLTAHY